jgi:hypothetical protein
MQRFLRIHEVKNNSNYGLLSKTDFNPKSGFQISNLDFKTGFEIRNPDFGLKSIFNPDLGFEIRF